MTFFQVAVAFAIVVEGVAILKLFRVLREKGMIE